MKWLLIIIVTTPFYGTPIKVYERPFYTEAACIEARDQLVKQGVTAACVLAEVTNGPAIITIPED